MVTTAFPRTGLMPAEEEEKLADSLVTLLQGCDLIEDLVGARPTHFTSAAEDVAWALYGHLWGDDHPDVKVWIKDSAYGPGGY